MIVSGRYGNYRMYTNIVHGVHFACNAYQYYNSSHSQLRRGFCTVVIMHCSLWHELWMNV